jgi:phospholipid transport system substrate-binding protein
MFTGRLDYTEMLGPTLRTMSALLALSIAVASVAPASDAAAILAAESTINDFNGVLLDIMKRADDLGLEGRANTIAPVVNECFDLPFMARSTIGRAWKNLSQDDQQRWVETFAAYIIHNLADRFGGFSGQSFEIVGQKPASSDTLIVQTMLRRPNDDDVRLDYRMREKETGWKVIDIYAKGQISEVALRRSEYKEILRDGDIDQLIELVSGLAK